MKKLTVVFGVFLFGILLFSNALDFMPKEYDVVMYIPDISKLYDAVKQTNAGDILANQIGLEQMFTGVIEQQLMMQGYTLDDLDIFKELLIVAGKESTLLVLGPSKDPNKIKELFENFSGQSLPEEVKIIDGYFVVGENYGGGTLPEELEDFLNKGYLAVSYINTNEEDFKVKGFGYTTLKGNEVEFHQEIVPQDDKTKQLFNDIASKDGIDILKDENIGGDLFGFINRKLPDSFLKSLPVDLPEVLEGFSGTAYICGDISSVLTNALSGMQVSNVPFYGVIYYNNPSWDMIEGKKRFENIGGKKYGIVETDEGTPVLYINLSNEKITLYGVSPDEYVAGDKDFIKENYSSDYVVGLFVNLRPMIFNFIGIDSESYFKFYGYFKDGKLIEKAVLK